MSTGRSGEMPSLQDLFRQEAAEQTRLMTEKLLALEHDPADAALLEALMRAAHSLKGAARIVDLDTVVQLAHQMEDCFVSAQQGKLRLSRSRVDSLLSGVDLIATIAQLPETEVQPWLAQHPLEVSDALVRLYEVAAPDTEAAPPPAETALPGLSRMADTTMATATTAPAMPAPPTAVSGHADANDGVLKVNVRHVDRLLSLASEARIHAHALEPQRQRLQAMKRRQHDLFAALEKLHQDMQAGEPMESLRSQIASAMQKAAPLRQALTDHVDAMDAFERNLNTVSQGMLDEVLALRMRPFRDAVQGFPRLVRDLARELGKEIRLVVDGGSTLVDRDVLSKMESALNHLLRNAIDHGIETPSERIAAGKPAQGTIRIEAQHKGGMLNIDVTDDGRGADLDRIRARVARRGMASEQMAASMSQAELLDFLLLPGFSLRDTTTALSGRGVGLDAVRIAIRELNGSIHQDSEAGKGYGTHIVLPLSHSVKRALIVRIAGEPYGIPIARIERIVKLEAADISVLENRQFCEVNGANVGLVSAARMLGWEEAAPAPLTCAVIIGPAQRRFGLVVDAIDGERRLVMQSIDPIFGKVPHVTGAALLDDGAPVLMLDVPDLLLDIEKMLSDGSLQRFNPEPRQAAVKRILVVDDSLTVREMQRQLLQTRGYHVDVAVDGMDGWHAVRAGGYDLLITDIDMPRMDGIELVGLVRKDHRLQGLPVMIVSYKDRPEDRRRGIEVGADYYLTKSSFHDETLLEAVTDLIGDSAA